MRFDPAALVLLIVFFFAQQASADPQVVVSQEQRLNNLTSILLHVEKIPAGDNTFRFHRPRAGWIFISTVAHGVGKVTITLDQSELPIAVIDSKEAAASNSEAFHNITAGEHQLRVTCSDAIQIDKLVVKSIPELMHCGLGFDPAIKSYGKYDLAFLKADILPNVTTLIVPSNIQLEQAFVDQWHRQGRKFIAATGINYQAKTADEHFQYWTGFFERRPFLDGIIIDEFIVNNPIREWMPVVTPERQKKFDEERAQYPLYEEAFRKIRADDRYREKTVYAYIGGSGKKLNQEIIGPRFIRTILDCGFRVGLERYIFEVSSEEKSKNVLQLFVDGISDWVEKEPAVREQMIITFGLFSMPPGGINKQPNVDYHVWMDQQMNVAANHPVMAGIAGFNWWTSLQADEETVRFVGRLYRHYAIDGKKELLTKDPLFLSHIQNADFEKGIENWQLHAAEEGGIQPKSFPRYGRIEGRYMGLGRPADPEHIGDTFLWMKRNSKGPNSFSQTIRNLEPGRLYSLKMFSCDYQDLINPTKKLQEQAQPFMGEIRIDGADVDTKRSFHEMYSSNPEPTIPVWITYHWMVFRATSSTAKLTVSDWNGAAAQPDATFGQEQTFNFLELQPYHE